MDYEKEYKESCKQELSLEKEKLADTNKRINELNRLKEELLKNPQVQEYVKTINELTELSKENEKLNRYIIYLTQESCEHPAWYSWANGRSEEEGRIFLCKCVACGMGHEITEKDKDFDIESIIYTLKDGRETYISMTYEEVKEEYQKLFKENENVDKEEGKKFVKYIRKCVEHPSE